MTFLKIAIRKRLTKRLSVIITIRKCPTSMVSMTCASECGPCRQHSDGQYTLTLTMIHTNNTNSQALKHCLFETQ